MSDKLDGGLRSVKPLNVKEALTRGPGSLHHEQDKSVQAAKTKYTDQASEDWRFKVSVLDGSVR